MLFHFFHKKTYPHPHETEFIPYARSRYKTYPRFPQAPLPKPAPLARANLLETIDDRRTCRDFDDTTELALPALSRILWGASEHPEAEGVNEFNEPFIRRRYPSPGALFPLEAYVACARVAGLEPGLYHYNVPAHGLEYIAGEESLEKLHSALTYDFSRKAACHILMNALWHRSSIKYGEFAYRATLIEAGHLAHTMLLLAESLCLGCAPLAGFEYETIDEILDVKGLNENFVYGLAIGPKARAKL